MVPQKPLQGCKAPDCSRSTLPWVDMKYSSLSTILQNTEKQTKMYQTSSIIETSPPSLPSLCRRSRSVPGALPCGPWRVQREAFWIKICKGDLSVPYFIKFQYIGDFTAVQIVPSSYKNQQDFHDEHYDIHCMSPFVSMATTKET